MKDRKSSWTEENSKKFRIRSMYFNLYLLVRYISALFFFTNLYWFIALILSDSSLFLIPLISMLVILLSIAEQIKIYREHTNHAKYTKYCFLALLIINVLLLIPISFHSSFSRLYPFLNNQTNSRLFVFSILVIGIILCLFSLHRLHQIQQNKDKHYERIKKYEKAIS